LLKRSVRSRNAAQFAVLLERFVTRSVQFVP
jgi:hypothetical protein